MNINEFENFKKQMGSKIPLYKKFWYSSTKFERYPEMASEGVGKAFAYLAWLIFIFALIMAIGLLIKFHFIIKQEAEILDKEFSEITYKNGELQITTNNENAKTDMGNVIINTEELSQEQIDTYENTSTNIPEIIWLKERVIVKAGDNSYSYYYKDFFNRFNVYEFNKESVLNIFSKILNSPKTYIIYAIAMIIYTFIAYFLSTLFEILILSGFGILTTLIAGIRIRYRAVFNMSVYAFTISTVLQLVYLFITLFTDFNIKYFDLMYTTIAFICLAASIFMIKSDVIKQQMQLMKIIEIKKQQEENEKQEETKDETKEEPKDDEKKDKKEEDKKEKNKDGLDTDAQGGEA